MNAAVRYGLLGLVAAVALAGATPRSARGIIYLNGGILAEYNPSTGANPGNGAGEFDTYGTLNAPFTFNGQSNPILLTPGYNTFNLSHIYLSGYFGLGLFFTDTSTLLPTYPPLSPHLDVYPNPTPNSPSGFAFPNAGVLVQTLGYNTEPSPYSGATAYTLGNGDRVTVSSWVTPNAGDPILTLFVDTAPPPPKTWTGRSPANPSGFDDANNWSPSGVPGASDDIQFGSSPSNVVVLPGGANPGATVRDIAIVSGASPVTFGAFGVNTPLNASSLTMSGGASVTLNNTELSIDSDVSIPGSLAVNGGATLNAGSLAAPGTHSVNVTPNGTVTIDGGGAMQASGLVANGTVNLNNGSLAVSSVSGSGGVVMADNNVDLHVTGSSGLTLGDGQTVKGNGEQRVEIGANSRLTVDKQLKLSSVVDNNGIFETLNIQSTGVVSAESLLIEGGRLGVTSGVKLGTQLLVKPGNTITVKGTSQGSGRLVLDNSVLDGGRSLIIEDGGLLESRSTLDVSNGALLHFKSGSTFASLASSTINVNAGAFNADTGLGIGQYSPESVTVNFSNGGTGSFGELQLGSETITGVVNIFSGSHVKAGILNIGAGGTFGNGYTASNNKLTVSGLSSSLAPLTPSSAMPIKVGAGFATSGNELRVQDEGLVDSGNESTTIDSGGAVVLDGGTLRTNSVVRNGTGVLTFNRGTLALTRTTGYTVDATSELGANPTLGSGKTLEINPTATTTIPSGQSFTLNGGTLNTGSLSLTGGTFNFSAGTLGITGTAGLTIGSGGFFGSSFTVGSGRTVNATNATINSGSTLTLGGGGFGSDNLTNNGTVYLNGGSLSTLTAGGTLTNSSTGRIFVPNSSLVSMGGAMTNANGGRITLQGGAAQLNGTGALTNSGLITGDGEIAKSVTNALTGEIRATAGQSLLFSSANGTNAGRINVVGGSVEFTQPLVNAATGRITGTGTYTYTGGLTNNGEMQFGGESSVYGNVSLPGGATGTSKFFIAPNQTVTIYGNLSGSPKEAYRAAHSTLVIFGNNDVTGDFGGDITAEIQALGSTSPGGGGGAGSGLASGAQLDGASLGTVNFGGNLLFANSSSTIMDLAGATPGSQHDQIHTEGNLGLAGSLTVTLQNGFSPVSGQAFDLFDWGSLSGQFASITLPALAGGLSWNTSQLYTRGIISIGKPGDFNGDTVSDAADYVLLRHAGGSGAAANYNVWRSNYGLGGSGSGSGVFSAIPEPVSATMAFFCAAALMLTTRRRLGRTETVASVL